MPAIKKEKQENYHGSHGDNRPRIAGVFKIPELPQADQRILYGQEQSSVPEKAYRIPFLPCVSGAVPACFYYIVYRLSANAEKIQPYPPLLERSI